MDKMIEILKTDERKTIGDICRGYIVQTHEGHLL